MRVNRAVFFNVWRGLLASPARLALAALGLLVFYGAAAQVGGLQGALATGADTQARLLTGLASLGNLVLRPLVWVLGFGLVSREAERGSLQLVLLRPLTRATYVLSKWAALTALSVALLLCVHGIFLAHGWLSMLGLGPWSLLLAAQGVQVAAVAAVLTLLSCVGAGMGEIGLLVLGWLLLLALQYQTRNWGLPWLDAAWDEGYRLLLPNIPTDGLLSLMGAPGQAPSADLAGSLWHNALVALGALALAVARLRRREFSYAGQS